MRLLIRPILPQAKAFEGPTVTGVANFVISRLSARPARNRQHKAQIFAIRDAYSKGVRCARRLYRRCLDQKCKDLAIDDFLSEKKRGEDYCSLHSNRPVKL